MKKSGTWIVIGSSPSAAAGYALAKRNHPRPRFTITTNSGIELERRPSFYFAHDPIGAQKYASAIRAAERNGTRILMRLHLMQFRRRPIRIRFNWWTWKHNTLRYVRGAYVHCGLSGWICTQFALNHGAEHVVWVGMEGYRSTNEKPVIDTFDGRKGHGRAGHVTRWSYGALMQSAVEICTDVRFTFYGQPVYALSGPNIQIVSTEEPSDVERERPHPVVQ